MADLKISQLTGATTPLAGTEVLPIVQGGATVKVSVANLTAGRSFDALGMTLTSTDAGATASPLLELYRDSASPAANDTIGEIEFNGEDSAGNKQAYGLIHGSILSPTSTAEQGQLHFETATAGALTEKMIIGTTNLVINEIGGIFNVRIEGDTDANLFYTDATNSRVGVGTISPSEKLDVVGKIKLSDNLVVGTAAKGIDFSANTGAAGMTSELLNWYEEGTFTPTFVPSGTGFTSITYDAATGAQYIRVGRVVHVQIWLQTTATVIGLASGVLRVGGLPFTTAASTGSTSNGFGSLSVSYADGFPGATPQNAMPRANSTQIDLYYQTGITTGPASQILATDMATGAAALVLAGTYICA
jgi:hypothetical protein